MSHLLPTFLFVFTFVDSLARSLCVWTQAHTECVSVHALFHILHIFIYRITDCVSASISSIPQKETDKNYRSWGFDGKKNIPLHFGIYKNSCEQNPCKSIDKSTWNVCEMQNLNRRTIEIWSRKKCFNESFQFTSFRIFFNTPPSLPKQKYFVCFIHSPAFIHSRYVNNNTQFTLALSIFCSKCYEFFIFVKYEKNAWLREKCVHNTNTLDFMV